MKRSFPLSQPTYEYLSGIENKLNDLFIRKFYCEVKLKGPKLQSRPEDSVMVYKKTLPCGLKISVWKDDMTRQDTDAVVNAANEQLCHAGGLAFALAKAGGPQVNYESQNFVFKNGPVKTGSIALTSGGNLPCKEIIHAVGPQWSEFNQKECKHKLFEVITNVLNYVKFNRVIKSVAIPAVSSGIFGFPLKDCAEIIVCAVKQFCDGFYENHLKEIRFVNNDDKTVSAMKYACENIIGSSDRSSDFPRAAQASSPIHQQNLTQQGPQYININGLNLYLKQGCIEDQTTNVIVNSVSSDLNLNIGNISRAILNKAGPKLQSEIFQAGKEHGAKKGIIATNGCTLPCSFVYHVILQNDGAVCQVLRNSVHQCLEMAHNGFVTSISFPALGTGLLGIPKQVVADLMVDTVVTVAQNSPRRMDVYFVIHPEDNDSYKAFENSFKSAEMLLHKPKEMNTTDHTQMSPSPHEEEPCAIILGQMIEEIQDAESWLRKILIHPEHVTIQNSHIFLFGLKEHEALVSPEMSKVSISLNMEDGRAILHIKGAPADVMEAALTVELMLTETQEKYADTLEDELFQTAVQWFYGKMAYPAKANKEIEKAYQMSQNTIELKISGTFHFIQIKDLTAKTSNQTFQLSRESLIQGSQKLVPLYEQVDSHSQEFKDQAKNFEKANLEIIKMVKVQNMVLSAVYQSRKDGKLKQDQSNKLYYHVPGHFWRLVCNAGFHRLYQDRLDSKYGAGIYFKKTLGNLMKEIKVTDPNSVIYIIQSEVKTGRFTRGEESHILPPPMDSKVLELYDSLVDSQSNPQTFVIFDRYQAKPQYLFTCKVKGYYGSPI
ncbi:protein mono-ADP-ribosyltransferase PARP9 isoform X1 [Bombina bombina]|uniref:protein mono-ADP-ribosyltransferase PARP9 isoform X1 n=1 Tax=Bombina bombina TaxID=8345 RepID=UPI00235A8FF4|nr:protein mono-ADP-ribosyltransferase PARP9 isoform X1 [Bombina bombina]